VGILEGKVAKIGSPLVTWPASDEAGYVSGQ
jgi:hypothetical protein